MDSKRLLWVFFLMVMWYITSIAAGVYNKDFLLKHDLPMLLTLCQSFAGVVGGLVALGSLRRIQYFSTTQELKILILLGLVHGVGTVLTNISTARSTASFTHTIKVRG
jgi:solute carrier family 35, member E1